MTDHPDEATQLVKPKLLRLAQILVMFVTAFLLGAHVTKWDAVQVDAITLALLGLLLVIPLADVIRKIKLGEFEAEIGREEVAKIQAKAAAELAPETENRADGVSEDRVRALLQEDPRLALAKVRIEIEEALKRLFLATSESKQDLRRLSLGRLVDELVRKEVLSKPVASALRDVIGLANRAVHGERVDSDAAQELALLGARLASEVQQLYAERVLRPVDAAVVTQEEVERYLAARYRVTTIIPLVKNPKRNTYTLNQEALDSFLEGYDEYAEFLVAVEPV